MDQHGILACNQRIRVVVQQYARLEPHHWSWIHQRQYRYSKQHSNRPEFSGDGCNAWIKCRPTYRIWIDRRPICQRLWIAGKFDEQRSALGRCHRHDNGQFSTEQRLVFRAALPSGIAWQFQFQQHSNWVYRQQRINPVLDAALGGRRSELQQRVLVSSYSSACGDCAAWHDSTHSIATTTIISIEIHERFYSACAKNRHAFFLLKIRLAVL